MLYSGRLLHKSVDWMKMHSGKLGTMPQLNFNLCSAFCNSLECEVYFFYPFSSVGERGRPQSISACQGSLVEGWRKWASKEGGGGYSFTAKQEVAQHLFLCVQRGSEWPAVSYCVSLCRKCCVQPDNMTLFPFSQFLHISAQWSFITQSPFPLMWYKWVLKVKYHSNISKLFQNVWQVALSKALKLKSQTFSGLKGQKQIVTVFPPRVR